MILSSISGALLLDRLSRFGGVYLVAARGRLTLGQTEFARLGNTVRQLLFHCVPQGDPAALVPGNGALNQNQPTLDIGLHDFEVQRGDALDAHMAGHLFVLERLAGILATTGRPMRAMRDGHAMGSPQACEIPAFHRTGESFADRDAGHVNELANHEMIGRDLGADRDDIALLYAELRKLALGLNLDAGEMPPLGPAEVLLLPGTRAELERDIAVPVLAAMRDDLAVAETQHGHRHMLPRVSKYARHSDFLCNRSGTHARDPVRS